LRGVAEPEEPEVIFDDETGVLVDNDGNTSPEHFTPIRSVLAEERRIADGERTLPLDAEYDHRGRIKRRRR
jgi:hypothetical protein